MAGLPRFRVAYRHIIILLLIGMDLDLVSSSTFSHVKNEDPELGQLALVQVVFRHGDRAPLWMVSLNTTEEKTTEEWPEGLGQLTAKGLKQTEELGEFFRKRYDNFLNETYFSDEILVMSTYEERAIRSALSLLRGLYPGGTKNKRGTSNRHHHQPDVVPLRTVPKKHGKFLLTGWNIPNCPKQLVETEKMQRESLEYQRLARENLSFQKEILNTIGNVTDEENLPQVLEYLKVLVVQNKSLPSWVTPRIRAKLGIYFFLYLQDLIGTPALQRLSSAFLQNVLANMEEILMDLENSMGTTPSHLLKLYEQDLESRRSDEPTKGPRKFYIFSAHDVTLVTLMANLGIFNNLIPPYAAAIIFETYLKTTTNSSQLFVQVFFRNSTEVAPIRLDIPKCSHPCRLDVLKKIVAPIIPQDYDKECESLV